ncbi:SDR family NAD(P)-dependent oxidoreductase [Actinomadura xylanilytica]|uniref:SDR family NAD(P)-dependent oxidoreductase n=1 Tax=Actinomadura xylanilytica TaxID=887459 RepID=UPI00255AE0B7|nr:SDR family NAD(P)-dependent oxidoreductase [Actinomadura xylanilytica]MDL4774125.1 SDR family NAD(P)-dependent oxidoreductase [Actinomadura xylanilytica]
MTQYRNAVVTGASGGIGAAFARRLAAGGSALVLVARDGTRLAALAAELERDHGADVEPLPADLADPAGLDRVAARVADPDRPVDLLVNGAGVLGGIGPLARRDPAELAHGLALNTGALVRLTRAALPGMLERGHGGVVNVSSVMGFLPAPGGAPYAAAKAFATSFSESLHGEVCWDGVHVTALCPGSTGGTRLHRSAGHRESGRLGRLLDVDDVARDALAAVAAGHPVCVPGLDYRWRVAMSRMLPRRLVRARYYRRWGRRLAGGPGAGAAPDAQPPRPAGPKP